MPLRQHLTSLGTVIPHAARRGALCCALIASAAIGFTASAPANAANTVTLTGVLHAVHADRVGGDFMRYALTTRHGRMVTVRLARSLSDSQAEAISGETVTLRGVRSHGMLTDAVVTRLRRAARPSLAAVTGTRKVAVMLVNFTNDRSQPWTPAQIDAEWNTNSDSIAHFFGEESYGQLQVQATVVGWYQLPISGATCDTNQIAASGNQAATAAGVNLNAYQNVVYAFPFQSGCGGWAGLGMINGPLTWNNGYAASQNVFEHELSHNLGLHHAASIRCGSVAIAANLATCTYSEYGDPFDIMGSSWQGSSFSGGVTDGATSNGRQIGELGWLGGGDTRTITASGDYTIAPLTTSAGVRVLRIARGDGTYLWLDYRQPDTYYDTWAASDPEVNGVEVHIDSDYGNITQTELVDTTPATNTFADAALTVGHTVTDPKSGAVITTTAAGPSGATVHVAYPTVTAASTLSFGQQIAGMTSQTQT